MASPLNNVSKVKLNVKKIIDNLSRLCKNESQDVAIENLKTSTEHLLTKLESLPLENFKRKLRKRQRKRFRRNVQKLSNQNVCKMRNYKEEKASGSEKLMLSCEPKEKHNRHMRSIKECKRFLQTFELLEQLHLTRGNNYSETYKFSLELRQLKSIWNCLLQEKLQEETSTDVTIQQQWHEVLFGSPEKTFFQDKPDLGDFLRKRQVWDSYIDNKFGTSIPIGWVLPHELVMEQWRPYISPTNT